MFRDKDITIVHVSPGMNAASDSVVGEPSYLLFTADEQHCAFMRKMSDLGCHGGTVVPNSIIAIYCAPKGETISRAEAADIAPNGLIKIGND